MAVAMLEFQPAIYKIFQWSVAIYCIVYVSIMVHSGWHIYKENNDLTRVGFLEYNRDSNGHYPTITFCFSREVVYIKGDYQNFKHGLNPTINTTTLNVKDFLAGFAFVSSSNGLKWWFGDIGGQFEEFGVKNLPLQNFSHMYISYQDFQTKCFSLDFTKLKSGEGKISYIVLFVNATVFPERTMKHPNFGIYFHYPNQLFLEPAHKLMRRMYIPRVSKKQWHYIKVQGMEVVNQRSTEKSPCKKDMDDYDAQILKKLIAHVGCKPPYWDITTPFEPCASQNDLLNFAYIVGTSMTLLPLIFDDVMDNTIQPCAVIKDMNLEYDNIPIHGEVLSNLTRTFDRWVFYFQGSKYKEVTQVREMDWEGFISYAGGYIGFYLGVGIMQFPEISLYLIKTIHHVLNIKWR